MSPIVKIRFLIIALVVLIISVELSLPDKASAHTIPTKVCANNTKKALALALASGDSWKAASAKGKRAYRKCSRYQKRHRLTHKCRSGLLPVLPRTITVKHVRATRAQRILLTRGLRVGYKMRLPRVVLIAYVMGATQESTATNLGSGHGTSVGHMQLIDSHGSVRWRMVIENSAGWFFRGARTVYRPGMSPGVLADKVQRPARLGAYQPWLSEATLTVNRFFYPCEQVGIRYRFQ